MKDHLRCISPNSSASVIAKLQLSANSILILRISKASSFASLKHQLRWKLRNNSCQAKPVAKPSHPNKLGPTSNPFGILARSHHFTSFRKQVSITPCSCSLSTSLRSVTRSQLVTSSYSSSGGFHPPVTPRFLGKEKIASLTILFLRDLRSIYFFFLCFACRPSAGSKERKR